MVVRRRSHTSAAGSDGGKAAGQARIVYIHGIGRQPDAETLKRQWDLALFGREMGDLTRMAYWADILHGDKPARAAKASGDPAAIRVDDWLEQAGVSSRQGQAGDLAHALLRTAGVEAAERRAKVLPLPAFLRKPIARAVLEALVKDTAAYFFHEKQRKAMQRRLRDALPKGDGPLVVVAHSQGSIIAHDVLGSLAADDRTRVDHWITIGSPLGIREVQDLLLHPGVVPDCVQAWHNFADPLDPVALDKGLGDDFRPAARLVDDIVLNLAGRRLGGFNPHAAVGYLAHPKVREVVHGAARIDRHARFLLARDVAADLAVEARHPVLIEMLEPGYAALGETAAELRAAEEKPGKERPELAARVEEAARRIEALVGRPHLQEARVDRLRRFVAAHLTPTELLAVARDHRELRVYAVWKSTVKRKLLHRSVQVVQADAAWASYGARGAGVTWAVLDTGVRQDHPHFTTHGTVAAIWDCTRPGSPKLLEKDRDRDGHGTHVSGIIAGEGPDGAVRGVAPLARLVVYKVLDESGGGEDAWLIKALDHIAAQNESGVDIRIHGLNLSLGGPYDSTVYGCGFTPVCAELRRLWRAGVLVVVASGNEGQVVVSTSGGEIELNSPMSIGDPANLEDCVAVGSVNADKPHLYGISAFSSRGPTSDGRMKPDVVAPGERINSCNSAFHSNKPEDWYRVESGTSMAAPHVSGLLAAFLSVRREFRGRPDEVKELLLRTCTDIHRDRHHQGHGIPNLMRMLLES